MKIQQYRNAYTIFEKLSNGEYLVALRIGTELYDKVRCDNYRMALEYRRAFNSIAKAA